METILNFVKKYGQLFIIGILLIIFFRGCGVNGDREVANAKHDQRLDSLITVTNNLKADLKLTNKELVKTIKIEGLKTEKRTLINTNNIFLTNTRPDNRYTAIDKEIEKLENDELVN